MGWLEIEKILSSPAMPFITFVLGGVLGFLGTRLSMTKAERVGVEQQKYENGVNHRKAKEERYVALKQALETYVAKDGSPTLEDFQKVSAAAELYFSELRVIADAILSDRIDRHSRNTFVADINDAIQKVVPTYYETLRKIAKKLNLPYGGKFDRANYENLYIVVEKYASALTLPRSGKV